MMQNGETDYTETQTDENDPTQQNTLSIELAENGADQGVVTIKREPKLATEENDSDAKEKNEKAPTDTQLYRYDEEINDLIPIVKEKEDDEDNGVKSQIKPKPHSDILHGDMLEQHKKAMDELKNGAKEAQIEMRGLEGHTDTHEMYLVLKYVKTENGFVRIESTPDLRPREVVEEEPEEDEGISYGGDNDHLDEAPESSELPRQPAGTAPLINPYQKPAETPQSTEIPSTYALISKPEQLQPDQNETEKPAGSPKAEADQPTANETAQPPGQSAQSSPQETPPTSFSLEGSYVSPLTPETSPQTTPETPAAFAAPTIPEAPATPGNETTPDIGTYESPSVTTPKPTYESKSTQAKTTLGTNSLPSNQPQEPTPGTYKPMAAQEQSKPAGQEAAPLVQSESVHIAIPQHPHNQAEETAYSSHDSTGHTQNPEPGRETASESESESETETSPDRPLTPGPPQQPPLDSSPKPGRGLPSPTPGDPAPTGGLGAGPEAISAQPPAKLETPFFTPQHQEIAAPTAQYREHITPPTQLQEPNTPGTIQEGETVTLHREQTAPAIEAPAMREQTQTEAIAKTDTIKVAASAPIKTITAPTPDKIAIPVSVGNAPQTIDAPVKAVAQAIGAPVEIPQEQRTNTFEAPRPAPLETQTTQAVEVISTEASEIAPLIEPPRVEAAFTEHHATTKEPQATHTEQPILISPDQLPEEAPAFEPAHVDATETVSAETTAKNDATTIEVPPAAIQSEPSPAARQAAHASFTGPQTPIVTDTAEGLEITPVPELQTTEPTRRRQATRPAYATVNASPSHPQPPNPARTSETTPGPVHLSAEPEAVVSSEPVPEVKTTPIEDLRASEPGQTTTKSTPKQEPAVTGLTSWLEDFGATTLVPDSPVTSTGTAHHTPSPKAKSGYEPSISAGQSEPGNSGSMHATQADGDDSLTALSLDLDISFADPTTDPGNHGRATRRSRRSKTTATSGGSL